MELFPRGYGRPGLRSAVETEESPLPGVQSQFQPGQPAEEGLDVLVGVIQGQIKALDLPILHMKEGAAQMWDAPADKGPLDATIDRLDHGYWTAAVNTGKAEKTILASFIGHRIGDVAQPSR